VDPDDHRAALGDPGGDPRVSETLARVVASLADNKAALGRRYAEWAVSAPTLESAVAAAAMAQDEMGHARSTYPVLKALGAEAGDEGLDGRGHRLALLDGELPDWTACIAANVLVDGVLTTFVAACVDSSLAPMAQRARKILQEEGSHRVHAEAWTRRLCRSGEAQRALLLSRLGMRSGEARMGEKCAGRESGMTRVVRVESHGRRLKTGEVTGGPRANMFSAWQTF
jgi:1,2-phenylacetyl-CoA epoxidase catalytic subunit